MTMKTRQILVVDDEQPTIDSLDILLGDEFHLLVARKGEEALEIIKSQAIDLVFLDISLPGIDGFEVLRQIKRHDDSVEVVMLTANEKAKTAMRALELGAFYYLTKPYDKDDVLLVVKRILEKKNMAAEITALRDDVDQLNSFHNIVGQDPKMRELFKLVEKVALTDSTVLITGESGTGKELFAKAIHLQSERRERHFKAINCAAIPEYLLESEVFGHEKGAFTGASERKIGKFEMANEGTVFLDEISTMPESMQVKLLRVIQEREIERVGGTKTIPIDVRLVVASNSDLRKLVERGSFREDLYYRINVIHLHIPPLRERSRDILLLAEHFLKFFSDKFCKPPAGLSPAAERALENYSWPGNVRELRNVVERAVVLSEGGPIASEHLPFDLAVPRFGNSEFRDPFALKDAVDRFERELIVNILERVGWNQTKAAEVLGIHRNTLLAKLDSYRIDVKQLKGEKEGKVLFYSQERT